MPNCLLIASDPTLATALSERLEPEGFMCDYAPTPAAAHDSLGQQRYHLILMDLDSRPKKSVELLRRLRQEGLDTPVMLLSKRTSLTDKTLGFEAGADDYVSKPFAIDEVFLRARALSTRRTLNNTPLSAGPLRLDSMRRTCELRGRPLTLTPITFRLLQTLLRDSPDPVSQSLLTREVWGDDIADSNKLRVHIHRLRQSLKPHGAASLIKTVPGFGFAIDANALNTPEPELPH